MINKIFLALATLVLPSLMFITTQSAVADKVCLRSKIVKGKIKHKTTTVADDANCPPKFTVVASSTTLATVGPQGPQGQKGATGATGPKGATGATGATGSNAQNEIFIASAVSASNSNSPKTAFATCPVGSVVIGGFGGVIEELGVPFTGPVAISFASVPALSNSSFGIRAYETSPTESNWQIIVFAQCRPS